MKINTCIKRPTYIEYDYNSITEDEIIENIKKEPNLFLRIKNPTEKICLEAMKINGSYIFAIPEPSYNVRIESVKQNGLNLLYIQEKNLQICYLAIKNNIKAIQYTPTYIIKELINNEYIKHREFKKHNLKPLNAFYINNEWYFFIGNETGVTIKEFKEIINSENEHTKTIYLNFLNEL